MNREYHHWQSPSLGREMEMLVFGHGGSPMIVFPTSQGRFFDYEDRGMVRAIEGPIERGRVQLFCVDSVDSESWYNYSAPPRARVARHMAYEAYILKEVLPFVAARSHDGPLTVTGCSFGGYHAVNLTLRHPESVARCISLGGAFDIKQFIVGYYDDDCYFNNPVDYLPNISDQWLLEMYRQNAFLILATGEHDICLSDNLRLSRILQAKQVRHQLDVWGEGTGHDWPWWQRMIAKFVQ